jgi:hypothetical protein
MNPQVSLRFKNSQTQVFTTINGVVTEIRNITFSIQDILVEELDNLDAVNEFKIAILNFLVSHGVNTLEAIAFSNAIGHTAYFYKVQDTNKIRQADIQLLVEGYLQGELQLKPDKSYKVAKKTFVKAGNINMFSAWVAQLGRSNCGYTLERESTPKFRIPSLKKSANGTSILGS